MTMAAAPNLDLNDKLVKRGLLVSWHGHRGDVRRVRTGRCLIRFRSSIAVSDVWLPCVAVQVVPS